MRLDYVLRRKSNNDFYFIYLFFSLVFCPFRAAPTAYGGSQAQGLIGAVATSLRHSHSNTKSEPHLRPIP